MKIRRLKSQDRPELKALLQPQAHFRAEEIRVALELIDSALAHSGQEDYLIYCAERAEGEILGYICYGQAPLTDAVFDIYWIVVRPDCWSQGTGSALLRRAEEDLTRRRARLLLIETSSTPPYEMARSFYRKHGYRELARIRDYYREGDDKVLFGKSPGEKAQSPGA